MGIVCGSVKAYPTIWETASSDAGGGHSVSHYSTIPVGSEMQYTKITRPKQPFCAAVEQISYSKYRGKRWEIPGSLMAVEQAVSPLGLSDPASCLSPSQCLSLPICKRKSLQLSLRVTRRSHRMMIQSPSSYENSWCAR